MGRAVMKAASENLVPVTLELGGKSPTIVAKGSVQDRTVSAIVWGKLLSGGQTCIAPDYALVHESEVWVSNPLSGGDRQLDEVTAVGDPANVVQIDRRDRVSTDERQRRAAVQ